MKSTSTLALFAALCLSSTAIAGFQECDGNEKFLLSHATLPSEIGTSDDVPISISGHLYTKITGNSKLDIKVSTEDEETSASFEQKISGAVPAQSPMTWPQEEGETEMNFHFYPPPQFRYVASNTRLVVKVAIRAEDEEGDFVDAICVQGTTRVK
ncbi:hypothetical protein BG011_007307 [Mortierella polycephala]|uniref:Phosphatidylglycerol/phosphatidylinositol transfer protein n=1 Tax=Mortierella polycephala TaxID=41804 RepID=A0A9P6TYF9_9FUNG|nr:hypothetical protein BG011_007307 [Mortierella polycephala]